MRKLLITLFVVLPTLMFSACNGASDAEKAVVLPEKAEEIMRTDGVIEAPALLFAMSAQRNGLFGNVFKICGEVTSFEAANDTNKNCNAVIVNTKNGDMYVVDYYSSIIQENPKAANDEAAQQFALPEVGDNVCIYAEYTGYSNTLGMPVSLLGGSEVLYKVLSRTCPDIKQKDIIGSDLFENVYVPFARNEQAIDFESVKEFAENCGFEYNVVEPTRDIVGSITIKSDEDNVYFEFMPDDRQIESVFSISYFQASSKSEVLFTNLSEDRDPYYNKFQTHILGESNKDTRNVAEQRKFLFSQCFIP